MLISSVFTLLYSILCIFLLNHTIKNKDIKVKSSTLFCFVILGIFIRLIVSYSYLGHKTDMGCFSAWADMLYENGIKNFYSLPEFTDYPPGYMYILSIIGKIKNTFSLTKGMESVLIKSPAMICDILMGIIIYFAAKVSFGKNISSVISGIYILNPATIINSSAWGQVDSVYLIFVILSLLGLEKRRIYLSFFAFITAVLLKPQALIFSPVFIFFAIDYIINNHNSKKQIFKLIKAVIASLLLFIVLIIPFGVENVLSQYFETISQYSYATVNAFNIWGLFGMNWTELSVFSKLFGYTFVILICVLAGVIFFKIKDNSRYYITSAFLCFATYMLCVKMHERYAFCAMALALIGFLKTNKRKDFFVYLFLTISQLINTSWILFVYEKNPNLYYKSLFIIVASFLNVILLIYQIICALKKDEIKFLSGTCFGIEKEDKKSKITISDVVLIVLITVIYSSVALYSLGGRTSPQSYAQLNEEAKISLSFDREYNVSKILLFNENIPVTQKNELTIEFYDENYKFVDFISVSECSVFEWNEIKVDDFPAKNISIVASDMVKINEIAFFDDLGEKIKIIGSTDVKIIDEQDLAPNRKSYYNSTYFDEIYHARTAYEFINGDDVYEWTHPPLGKIFISLGISLFGMTPFGWRISGTVFGILMLLFIYLFMKSITNKSFVSFITTTVFAFDFMHFTQTRIATIDVYITFFVILMYYFMYSYYKMSFYKTPLIKTFIPLLLSGICFGLGVACKWTGVYAGAGLFFIFFITIYKRFREFLLCRKNTEIENSDIIIKCFWKNTLYTILFCVLAFIIIPVIIYLLSYIPYIKCEGGGIGTILKNQMDMFVYHSKTVLDSTHPYSSKWYEWIIMKRPIWYYSQDAENGLKEGISAFGNPLVWWVGILAMLFMIYRCIFKKDKTATFITIGYFAQLIPWMFVDRVVFIYHYFPCTVFLVLSIGYSIYLLYKENPKYKTVAFIYMIAVVMMFIAFYPVLSGRAVSPELVDRFLRWFESWVLI